MKHTHFFFTLITISYVLIFVDGCSYEKHSLAENKKTTPVFINPDLTITAYMADTSAVKNLSDELSMPWSIKVAVKQLSGKIIREVDSCKSILTADSEDFKPMTLSHTTAYQSALMRCRAIALAVEMTPSTISYLKDVSLSKAAVSNLPAAMAFIPSISQQASIDADVSLKSLNDVTQITGFTQVSVYQVELQIKGGSQNMVVLAKGDTNGDQIEDLLLQVINATQGGTYRATHLFILSRKKEGNWVLLAEY